MASDYMQLNNLTDLHKRRWKVLSQMDIVPTKFYDVPTLQGLGLFEVTKMLLDQVGLGAFMEKSAPTYTRYLLEFLSTVSSNDDRISFHLNDVQRSLTFDELRDIFGISRPPTRNWKKLGKKHEEVWSDITGSTFNSQKGETNYKLIHPCWVLMHKVIKMAFIGRGEVNKVTVADLGWFWSLFKNSNVVPDWVSLFVGSCIREQAKPNPKGKLVLGGMLTLIARKWEPEPPEWFDPKHGSHLFDERSLMTATLLTL